MSSAPESLSPSLNIITELHSQLSVCSDCYARAQSVESLVSSSWETFSPPALITSIRSSAHQTGLHPLLSTPTSTSQPGHCLHFLLSQVRIRYESCETMQRGIIDMFQIVQVHFLLWNTECLFCNWFKPISTWTFPSTTISGGKRRRRRRRRSNSDLDEDEDDWVEFQSLPVTPSSESKRYRDYYYEKPYPGLRQIDKRKLEVSESDDEESLLVNSKTLTSLKTGLLILVKIMEILLSLLSLL